MSHYAKVVNGRVLQVITAEADFFKTFVDFSPGDWIQTSYNTRGGKHYGQDNKEDGGVALRGNYAGIGYIYDAANDVFYPPQPFPSWTISAPDWTWIAPVAMPSDAGTGTPPKGYLWNEAKKQWDEVVVQA
jgi:hypothetical protein